MVRKQQAVDSQRRSPQQARAKHTVSAILEAAAQVLHSDGRAGFNTNRVAERAGVAISTLYQYFADKEAILLAVARRELDHHRDQVIDVLRSDAEAPGAEPDRVALRRLIDTTGHRHQGRRIAMQSLAATDADQELARPAQEMARVLSEHADKLMPGLAQPLSAVRVFVLTRAIQGVLAAGLREETPFYRSQEFEDELVNLLRGYVGTVSPAVAAAAD